MLLYIHVPFCRSKCLYCAFSSQVYTPELEQSYFQALAKEIRIRGDQAGGKEISSIYLGGGTPTLLSALLLTKIIDLAASHFSLAPELEFTVEANPEDIKDKDYPSALKDLGVNRLSLGVQSLDDEILARLGRRHTADQAMRAAVLVREAGLDNLSLDLIWGLPGQTLEGWMEDLETALILDPKHVSCYGLTLEPDTPLARMNEAGQTLLPEDHVQSRMYLLGGQFLESKGLMQYEVSNFARQGFICRHNTGYWEGEEFLGLGPSAVSTVKGIRWKNPGKIQDYSELAESSFKNMELEELDGRKLANERIMLCLRTTKGLKLSDYKESTGEDFLDRFRDQVNALCKNKLAVLSEGRLSLTKTGMLVSNSIIERFIS